MSSERATIALRLVVSAPVRNCRPNAARNVISAVTTHAHKSAKPDAQNAINVLSRDVGRRPERELRIDRNANSGRIDAFSAVQMLLALSVVRHG